MNEAVPETPPPAEGTPATGGDASLYFGMPEYAMYVNDSWNVSSKLTVSLGLPTGSSTAADIAFRYLQRLSQALADRLERFQAESSALTGDEPAALDIEPGRARPTSDQEKPRARALGAWTLAAARLLAGSLPLVPGHARPRPPSRPARARRRNRATSPRSIAR